MKKFNDVVLSKRRELSKERKNKINEQRKEVLNRLMKDRYITSPYALNESARTSLKATMLQLWNPNTGLTKKGYKYLFESEIPDLTPQSTPDDIKNWIVSFTKSDANNVAFLFQAALGLVTDKADGYNAMITKFAKKIADMTQTKIDPKKLVPVFNDLMMEALNAKAEQIKAEPQEPEKKEGGDQQKQQQGDQNQQQNSGDQQKQQNQQQGSDNAQKNQQQGDQQKKDDNPFKQ